MDTNTRTSWFKNTSRHYLGPSHLQDLFGDVSFKFSKVISEKSWWSMIDLRQGSPVIELHNERRMAHPKRFMGIHRGGEMPGGGLRPSCWNTADSHVCMFICINIHQFTVVDNPVRWSKWGRTKIYLKSNITRVSYYVTWWETWGFTLSTLLILVHPGRFTWYLNITYSKRKIIFQTSTIMFNFNLRV